MVRVRVRVRVRPPAPPKRLTGRRLAEAGRSLGSPRHTLALRDGRGRASWPRSYRGLSSLAFDTGDGRQVLLNDQAGHLLRAKLADVDEGGVCAGFAVLSSPVLFP